MKEYFIEKILPSLLNALFYTFLILLLFWIILFSGKTENAFAAEAPLTHTESEIIYSGYYNSTYHYKNILTSVGVWFDGAQGAEAIGKYIGYNLGSQKYITAFDLVRPGDNNTANSWVIEYSDDNITYSQALVINPFAEMVQAVVKKYTLSTPIKGQYWRIRINGPHNSGFSGVQHFRLYSDADYAPPAPDRDGDGIPDSEDTYPDDPTNTPPAPPPPGSYGGSENPRGGVDPADEYKIPKNYGASVYYSSTPEDSTVNDIDLAYVSEVEKIYHQNGQSKDVFLWRMDIPKEHEEYYINNRYDPYSTYRYMDSYFITVGTHARFIPSSTKNSWNVILANSETENISDITNSDGSYLTKGQFTSKTGYTMFGGFVSEMHFSPSVNVYTLTYQPSYSSEQMTLRYGYNPSDSSLLIGELPNGKYGAYFEMPTMAEWNKLAYNPVLVSVNGLFVSDKVNPDAPGEGYWEEPSYGEWFSSDENFLTEGPDFDRCNNYSILRGEIFQFVGCFVSESLKGIGFMFYQLLVPSEDFFGGKIQSTYNEMLEGLGFTSSLNGINSLKIIEPDSPSMTLKLPIFGGREFSVMDFSFFESAKPTFFKWIRGIFYFLLTIGSLKHFLSLVGLYNFGTSSSKEDKGGIKK